MPNNENKDLEELVDVLDKIQAAAKEHLDISRRLVVLEAERDRLLVQGRFGVGSDAPERYVRLQGGRIVRVTRRALEVGGKRVQIDVRPITIEGEA